MENWNSNTLMVTGFKNASDVYQFLQTVMRILEERLEGEQVIGESDYGRFEIDLEYVAVTVTAASHRLILSYRFLSRGDVFRAFAERISASYPYLLLTHLVIGLTEGELRLRQIHGAEVTYDRTMPAVVGSAIVEELESEPQESGISFHTEDLFSLSEAGFKANLATLKTPVFNGD